MFRYHYFFLPMYGSESTDMGQIFEMEILMELYTLKTPESENHIFSSWSVHLSRGCFSPNLE